MQLIIPAVEIKDGRCVQMVQGVQGFYYSDDPVEMARLWRLENTRCLHVTDIDGAFSGHVVNVEAIKKIVRTVDIPIEFSGGLRTFDDVNAAFDLGIHRVVLGTMMIENPEEAERVLAAYDASKIAVSIDALDGIVAIRGMAVSSGVTSLSVALNAKAMGFRRMVYTNIRTDGTLRGVNIRDLRELAERTGMRITAAGGVSGLEDLMVIQSLEPLGVDSVIVGRALYENKFSCQGLWRQSEAGNYPYTARI
jgi:phosphoribosylformimino-5-aminoimidazole carboxamide ribotide isomerase